MFDILIVGSGAGGGAAALALSEAGHRVLVLEKGRAHSREDYRFDEVASLWRDMFVPALADDPHILVHDGLAAPRRSRFGWTASCLGGATAHMSAIFSRFHPDDLRMRSRFGPCEEIADWPYGYDALEAHYTRAEWEVGVSGEAGSDPFEGPRSRPYPLPPLASHPMAPLLDEVCRQRGLHPFPTARAIASRPYMGRPACAYCSFCGGFGCALGARGSTQEALLPRAQATGRCEVRTGAMVRRITVNARGRASGCIYIDENGLEHRVRARVVCVCCSAIESARLLLLSRSRSFPNGLANGSGLVGRHLQFHATSSGAAGFQIDRHPGKPLSHPHPFFGRSLADYYFLPPHVSTLPKGGLLVFRVSTGSPILAAMTLAQGPRKTIWGQELMRRLKPNCSWKGFNFEVHHDFLPNRGTFVELDPTVQDRWGLPVARIHLAATEHQRIAGRWLVERGLELLAAMGADALEAEAEGETAPYLVHGTCRAGENPDSSVLDPYCRAHEVPNLFVLDGSFMPTSGGAPPTLTILANSFRSAAHIVARAKAGDFG